MLNYRRIALFLAIPLSAPLLVYAGIGTYSRYMADDYCVAAAVHRFGFWGSQLQSYLAWSGRFSAHFLESVLASLGVRAAAALPGIVIVGFIASCTFAFRSGLRGRMLKGSLSVSLTLALLTVSAFLQELPNVYQSLLWQDAILFHTVPLVLGVGHAGWLTAKLGGPASSSRQWLHLLVALVSGFVLAGFNEAFTSVLLMACGLATVVRWWSLGARPWQGKDVYLFCTLLGALLGAAVDLAAPGNSIRLSAYRPNQEILALLVVSVKDGGHFVKQWLASLPYISLCAAGVACLVGAGSQAVAGEGSRSANWAPIFSIPVVSVLLLTGVMLPLEYATSSYPVDRVLTVAQFLLAAAIVAWGYFLGGAIVSTGFPHGRLQVAARRATVVLVVVGVVWATIAGTARALELVQDTRAFASAWDNRDARIREAVRLGSTTLRVPSLTSMGTIAEIAYDPGNWVNQCVAEYYGLDSVIAK